MNTKKYCLILELVGSEKDEGSKIDNFSWVITKLLFILCEKTTKSEDQWMIYVRQSLNFAK